MFQLDPYTPSRAIADCFRVGQNLLRTSVKPLGIEAGQADCLLVVAQNPGITQSELSEWLFISQPATARMVRSLCDKGFLERQRDEKDSRIWHIFLGSEGEAIKDGLIAAFDRIITLHDEALEPAERVEFQRLITKTLGHLVDATASAQDQARL